MNDDRIVEYLRSRGRSTPPHDLIDHVMRRVAAQPRRRPTSWFAPLLPAAAAVSVAAVVAVLAALVTGGPSIGPPGPFGSMGGEVTAAATPSPAPRSTTAPSPSVPATPGETTFSPAPHAEADALFEAPDQCTNPVAGYTVDYPDPWYTNTEIGEVAACSWFAPGFYVVEDPALVPPEIVIVATTRLEGDVTSPERLLSTEELVIDGRGAVRAEYAGGLGQGGQQPPDWRGYEFLILLGESREAGPNLLFRTTTDEPGDYELNKAVLDRIVGRLIFAPSGP